MKRIVFALFTLILVGVVLSGCVPEETDLSVVDSITVRPRNIAEKDTGKTDEYLTITVKLFKDADKVELKDTYLFIKTDEIGDERKAALKPGTQIERKDNDLTFTVAYTWLQNLDEGEHNVGVVIKFPNATVKEYRKDTGILQITK